MLSPYYLDDQTLADPRPPHDSGRTVDYSVLRSLGVLHWHIPVVEPDDDYEEIYAITNERGYRYRDIITLSHDALGDALESVLRGFYQEHMNEVEEAKYILHGHGYWDIREPKNDSWIRFKVGPGDLVIIPPGMFHRFTVDEEINLTSMRLFLDGPRRAIPRGKRAERSPQRLRYLKAIAAAC